jgi:hypothetical protein
MSGLSQATRPLSVFEFVIHQSIHPPPLRLRTNEIDLNRIDPK